jgi:hypothetical protein
MNLNDAHPGGQSRIRSLAMLVLVALLAASCGPLGDDDDPTATSETLSQPTTDPGESTAPAGTDEPGIGTPETVVNDITDLIAEGVATPAGTPVGQAPDGGATPLDDDEVVISTPAVPGLADDDSDATPMPAGDAEESVPSSAPVTGSDGTSGATPPGDLAGSDSETESPSEPAATPGGTTGLAVLEESTPPPADVDLDTVEPVEVDSCEPSDVPIIVDGELSYVTNTDVNFRTGPGSDCDTIGDGPLGSNIPVAVVSAPVVREGEEEYVWVQVRVNDITGWVIVEAIEPAE